MPVAAQIKVVQKEVMGGGFLLKPALETKSWLLGSICGLRWAEGSMAAG